MNYRGFSSPESFQDKGQFDRLLNNDRFAEQVLT